MAYSVTTLVRRSRLPETIVNRPLAKVVLLALADRCDQDGRNAWPSLATICAECEIESPKTVRKHLSALEDHGLIQEQTKPSQHRPRTWQVNLNAIHALIPGGPSVTPLDTEGPSVTPLDAKVDAAGQPHAPDRQPGIPEGHLPPPGGPPITPDPVLLNCPLNDSMNNGFHDEKKREREKDYGGDFGRSRSVITALLDEHPEADDDTVMQLAEAECLRQGIDTGDSVLMRVLVIQRTRRKLFPTNQSENGTLPEAHDAN